MSRKNLSTNIGKLELRNPTLLAAGILGQTGANLKRVWKAGAGAVITKSVGLKTKEGYPGPNIVETPCGLLNAMGLPNPGIEEILEEIKTVKEAGGTIIGSVFGEEPEEYKVLAQKMEEANTDAVELNLSCPHAEGLSIIGRSPELTGKIIETVREIDVPVWAKLPGNTHLPNLRQVARSAEKAGADAIVLTNTIPGMSIDIETEEPILGHKTGGLSGPAIKPIGIRLVYEVFQEVNIPIIGAGGVTNGEDMIEYMLAGASAVEIGTGIMWEDLEIFEKVCKEAENFLKNRKIENMIGGAHEN